MKFILLLCVFAFGFTANFGQTSNIDAEFQKNKAKYKLDIFSEGEDASSGSDYLVYKKGSEIVKVREIWSSLSYTTYSIEDYYFKDGKIVAYAKYSFAKKYYNSAKKGTKVPMTLSETLFLTDSKLTAWAVNGKAVEKTDNRWTETETDINEKAKFILEAYQQYKAERN